MQKLHHETSHRFYWPFTKQMKRKVFRGFFGREWCGREDRSPLRFTRFLPDSDTRKRTKQGCMYHRLYHRSWFAGLGTCPCGLPQRVARQRPSVDPRGVFPGDLRVTESPRQPVGCHLSQASQRVSRGVQGGDGKRGLRPGRKGHAG